MLEVGSGAGLWTRLLRDRGADVHAVDLPGENRWSEIVQPGRYAAFEAMPAQKAVLAYPNRAVLSVWPCEDDAWLAETLQLLAPGRVILLMCAGTHEFIARHKSGESWPTPHDSNKGSVARAKILHANFEQIGESAVVPNPIVAAPLVAWRRRTVH